MLYSKLENVCYRYFARTRTVAWYDDFDMIFKKLFTLPAGIEISTPAELSAIVGVFYSGEHKGWGSHKELMRGY